MQNITIIILNYNSWQATVEYILILRKQKDIHLSFLVVDNCSPDGSYQELSSHYSNDGDVLVIKSDYNGGYAYGNNYGLKYLRDRIDRDNFVLITNNDIVIDNEILLKCLIESYNECHDIAFISPVMNIDKKPARNCAWKIPSLKYDITTVVGFNRVKANELVYYELPLNQNNFRVDCLSGSFFLGRLDTFILLNYFDERTFLFEEERILAQKIKNLGLSNYLALKLKFHHISSSVINKEINHLDRLTHLFNSRVVFHKYYADTNPIKVSLLKSFYALYIQAKRIQILLKKGN